MGIFNTFVNDEAGAITVDWVVLSAGIITLALAGVIAARSGILLGTSVISSNLTNMKVGGQP